MAAAATALTRAFCPFGPQRTPTQRTCPRDRTTPYLMGSTPAATSWEKARSCRRGVELSRGRKFRVWSLACEPCASAKDRRGHWITFDERTLRNDIQFRV